MSTTTMRSAIDLFDRPDADDEPFIIIAPVSPHKWAAYYQGTDPDLIDMAREFNASVPVPPFGRA